MPRQLRARRLASGAAPIMLLGGPYHGLRVLWRPGHNVRRFRHGDGPWAAYRLRGDGRHAKYDGLAETYRAPDHAPPSG